MALLSFMALLLMLANKVHPQNTTSFTFDSFVANPPDLDYQGGAHVPSGSTILRLTKTDDSGKPVPWSVGRVLYSGPVKFWEKSPARQATFETTMKFVITPATNGAADGIAFFIAPVSTTIPNGSSGANLGIYGSSGTSPALFAVEFDTYVNPGWDPNYRHIGININSRTSRATARFASAVGQGVTARISYEPSTRVISVVATSDSQSATFSYVFDLKTVLPEEVQVGISSSTGGDVSALGIADISSWDFNSTLVRSSVNDESENEDAYIDNMRQSDYYRMFACENYAINRDVLASVLF